MTDKPAKYGPFHRTGSPGGPGCAVGTLKIVAKGPNGLPRPAVLLCAPDQATEVELLRTVAEGLAVQWGHDDLGWWAVVPIEPDATAH